MKEKSKSITIINQDSGYLMIDIANEYANSGYNVNLISGRLVQRNNVLHQDVKYIKIIQYNRRKLFYRLSTWLIAFFQIFFLILFRYRKSKLLIVSNPPFAPFVTLFIKCKYDLLIYDIYPDILHEMKVIPQRSVIIKLWDKANNIILGNAERIITISKGMQRVLQNKTSKSIELIPIWTDNDFLKPIEKDNNYFIKKHKLESKFIVLYSGNLGYSHDVGVILELAKNIDDPKIQFVIIGEGNKKKILESRISEEEIKNCIMLPFQSAHDFPHSLASADIAIVTLGHDASKLSIPSKIYNIMSVGAPILAIASKDSDLASLIEYYKIGMIADLDKIEKMVKFILELSKNKKILDNYRFNSLKASKDFGVKNVKKII